MTDQNGGGNGRRRDWLALVTPVAMSIAVSYASIAYWAGQKTQQIEAAGRINEKQDEAIGKLSEIAARLSVLIERGVISASVNATRIDNLERRVFGQTLPGRDPVSPD